MTRKDYVLIAAALKDARDDLTSNGAGYCYALDNFRRIANKVADALAADNPRFDRARFLQACGVQS